MFEHWKAYKNRQNENLNGDPTTAKHSRAESFASLVSVIRNCISRVILSQPREISGEIETISGWPEENTYKVKDFLMHDHNCLFDLVKHQLNSI